MGLVLNSSSLLRHMNHELAHRQAIVLKELSGNVAAALEKLDRYEDALRTMSPKTTLLRGYSITLGRDRKVLRDAHDAAQEDRITTILAQGTLHSVVYDKEP
jgi:exonuclease VII large subunit